MHGASLIGRVVARAEQRGSVNQPCFVVAAYAEGSSRPRNFCRNSLLQLRIVSSAGLSSEKRAASTQIKNDACHRFGVDIQNRSYGPCVRLQPLLDLFTLWNSRKTTCRTKSVVREARVYFCQPLQSFPCGLLADRDVRVVRLDGFAVRGVRDAHGQPRADQRIENGQLQLIQWKRTVISRDDGSCSLLRFIVSKNAVSGGDRRLRCSDSVVHIAKINQAHDLARLRPRIADQYVVIVSIAVNYRAAQTRQDRHDFRFIEREKFFHQRAPLRIANILDVILDPSRARRIPFQFALCSRVRKRLQRRVQLPQKPAEIAEKLRCVRVDFSKNLSIQKGEQPNEARRTIRRGSRSKQVTAAIGHDPRQWQLRRALRQMRQRPALQINEGMLPRRVHYFEDERLPVRARQMEVVVVFAWQRPSSGFNPVEFVRQAHRFRFRHRLSYAGLQLHAPNLIRNSRSASILDGL